MRNPFANGHALPACGRSHSSVIPDLISESGVNGSSGNEFGGVILTQWDPSLSDKELSFSNNDATCRRPGNASCYPASMIKVHHDSVSVTMRLSECPVGPNSMSIGIAFEGFRRSGSDGFGPSTNSWGLIESRSSGSGKIYSNRSVVGAFRKMQSGDVFLFALREIPRQVLAVHVQGQPR